MTRAPLFYSLILAAAWMSPDGAWAACAPKPAECRISSKFGHRIDPITKQYTQMHRGTDFACPMFTTLKASMSGKVVHAGWSNSGGNMVYIQASDGTRLRYLHNSEITVQVGQSVSVGEEVAKSGNTGHRTTGPHLHLAADKNGDAIDPESLICGGSPSQAPVEDNEATPPSGVMASNNGGAGAAGSGQPEAYPEPIDDLNKMPLMQGLADIVGSRSLNPTYAKTLATMSEARLYDEVIKLKATTARTDHAKQQIMERINAIQAQMLFLRNEETKTQLSETRAAAAAQASNPNQTSITGRN